MAYDIKTDSKQKGKKMDLTGLKKNNADRQIPKAYLKSLTFFPLSEDADKLCRDIDENLFQLEKDLSYFKFAINEIKDIIKRPVS